MVRSAVIVELRRNPNDTLGNRIGNTVHTPPYTIETISKSTATTNTRSLAISKVGLHCDRGLAGGLYIVIAPHHPHLKMGANTGSNNRNLHPQQVVSHPPFSSARPCTSIGVISSAILPMPSSLQLLSPNINLQLSPPSQQLLLLLLSIT
jgi:hypothetical protein